MTYRYYVSKDEGNGSENKPVYEGSDIGDAMAAWSSAVADNVEYVVLEALLEARKEHHD